jgi:excisionase family DNA binding protein
MQIPYTPTQVAKIFGVAPITVYKWIESGKLASTSVKSGHSNRIYISQEAVDLKKAELDNSCRDLTVFPPSPPEDMEWVKQYRDLLGRIPALYPSYRRGNSTFDQMKNEAIRRFKILSK